MHLSLILALFLGENCSMMMRGENETKARPTSSLLHSFIHEGWMGAQTTGGGNVHSLTHTLRETVFLAKPTGPRIQATFRRHGRFAYTCCVCYISCLCVYSVFVTHTLSSQRLKTPTRRAPHVRCFLRTYLTTSRLLEVDVER